MTQAFQGAWAGDPAARDRAKQDVGRLGWLYVHRFAEAFTPAQTVAMLDALTGDDMLHLRAFTFLGSDAVVELLEAMPALRRTLPRVATRVRHDSREIRGPVSWSETSVLQAATGDHGNFVIVDSRRSNDSPENRILAYLLGRVAHLTRMFARSIRALGADAERHLASPMLAGLPTATPPSGRDRQRLRTSRHGALRRHLTDALSMHDEVFSDDRRFLIQALERRIWLPEADARLFELWCLFRLVETMCSGGWTVTALTLMGSKGGGRPTFVLQRAEIVLEVSFQGSPSSLVEDNVYGSLLTAYGFASSVRRPDIVVSRPGKEDSHLIIEVKLTEDRSYIVDSIYKMFGYLGDFKHGLRYSGTPAAILIVWAGIGVPASTEAHPVRILSAKDVDGGLLSTAIEAHFATTP